MQGSVSLVIQDASYEILFPLVGGHISTMFFYGYELIKFTESVYSALEVG